MQTREEKAAKQKIYRAKIKEKLAYETDESREIRKAKSAAYYAANVDKNKIKCAKYRAKNIETIKAKEAKYRSTHKDEARAYSSMYQAANKEKLKAYNAAYRDANKEKLREYSRIYNLKNKECAREKWPSYYAENSAKIIWRANLWQKNNPEAVKIRHHTRRARKINAGGVLSKGLSEKLFKLQRGKCPCCKLPLGSNYHMDHIMPLALGGSNTDDNIQLLRAKCNLQKSAKHPVDFMQSRGFLF